jgi:prepilin-type N-terminal cleavage/methylation domain-containing protein
MMKNEELKKSGFTLLELIVVIAIIGILAALILVGVQRVRSSAAQAESTNNLRQIGLAIQHCQAAMGVLPPGFGYFPGGPNDSSRAGGQAGHGNVFFHLLPFLEQNNLYQSTASAGNGPPPLTGKLFIADGPSYPGIAATALPIYINPSDPSVASPGVIRGTGSYAEGWGAGCYAFNAQAFCAVDQNGQFLDWFARPRLPQSFPDGTSTTILFAEKYAVCGQPGTPLEGVSAWAAGPAPEATPVFAVSIFPVAGLPPNDVPPTGPTTIFDVQPSPYQSDTCHYWLPQAARSAGILISLADGSARLVSGSISPETWWAACTPAGGDTLGDDW